MTVCSDFLVGLRANLSHSGHEQGIVWGWCPVQAGLEAGTQRDTWPRVVMDCWMWLRCDIGSWGQGDLSQTFGKNGRKRSDLHLKYRGGGGGIGRLSLPDFLIGARTWLESDR